MAKHLISDLYQMQAMPLEIKVRMTQNRIRGWVNEYGIDGVYVSFSGGKDSTVLLDMVRELYPDVKAVFVDTGLEYPEIRKFVKSYDNVDWLRPKMTFKQVIEKYGYPFISKEVSECVYGARRFVKALTVERERERERDRRINHSIVNYAELENIAKERGTAKFQMMMGVYPSKVVGKRSAYNQEKWKFFLEAPFEISSNCCKVMKKSPVHTYARQTGRKPITAQMASESRLRTQQWLKNGCNGFNMTSPISNPMSFWTEQDVLAYIYEKRLPICSVYGEVVIDSEAKKSQKQIDEFELFDIDRPTFKTTGCNRTGCMFCGYGCHLEATGEGRFERMKETHPKLYDYIMRKPHYKEVIDPVTLKHTEIFVDGLNYKEVIDWINEHGNTDIKY